MFGANSKGKSSTTSSEKILFNQEKALAMKEGNKPPKR
jgi:hypothetical protein